MTGTDGHRHSDFVISAVEIKCKVADKRVELVSRERRLTDRKVADMLL